MNNPRGRWMAAGLLAALCIGCLGALFGGTPPDANLWASFGAVFVLLITGIYFFRRMEKTFADVV